jgi:hypothetical protein
MALPASSSGLFRFLSPRSRPQSTDITAAATWGVFAGAAGLYLVQVRIDPPAHSSYLSLSHHPPRTCSVPASGLGIMLRRAVA